MARKRLYDKWNPLALRKHVFLLRLVVITAEKLLTEIHYEECNVLTNSISHHHANSRSRIPSNYDIVIKGMI